MSDLDWSFINANNEGVKKGFSLLMKYGYFNDENSGLGSSTLERRLPDVEKVFREMGYKGAKLTCYGWYYPDHGAVYWAYDDTRVTHDEARKMTDTWVKKRLTE